MLHGTQSDTIRTNFDSIQRAQAALRQLQDGLASSNLTTLHDQRPAVILNDQTVSFDNLDRGMRSLLAKAVASRATVFLVGAPIECAKQSSFSQEIVQHRAAAGLDPLRYFPADWPRTKAQQRLAYKVSLPQVSTEPL